MCLELFPALAANDSSSIWRSLFRSSNRPSLHAPRRQQRTMDSLCRTIKFRRLRNRISEILARRFHIFIGARRARGRDSSTIRNSEIFSFHPTCKNRSCVRISIELEAHFVAHKLTLTTFQFQTPRSRRCTYSDCHFRYLGELQGTRNILCRCFIVFFLPPFCNDGLSLSLSVQRCLLPKLQKSCFPRVRSPSI